MAAEAVPCILWNKNESGAAGKKIFFVLYGRNDLSAGGGAAELVKESFGTGGEELAELADELRSWRRRAGGGELAERKKFSPIRAAGGSGEGPPRPAEENFLSRSPACQKLAPCRPAEAESLSPARIGSSAHGLPFA